MPCISRQQGKCYKSASCATGRRPCAPLSIQKAPTFKRKFVGCLEAMHMECYVVHIPRGPLTASGTVPDAICHPSHLMNTQDLPKVISVQAKQLLPQSTGTADERPRQE